MFSRVMFGDRLDFEPFQCLTRMFVNNVFIDEVLQSGDFERDIRILITRSYAE
jgi:hypothetical protein